MHVPAAKSRPFGPRTADLQLVGGLIIVRGLTVRETTGAAVATIEIYDGTGTNGTLIDAVHLLASATDREFYAGEGIEAISGCFLHVVTGTVKGAIWYSPATLVNGFAVADGLETVWSGDL